MSLPLVEELSPAPEPFQALRAFADDSSPLLMESARQSRDLGRYSFLTADPPVFEELQTASYGDRPFAALAEQLAEWTAETVPELPPFQGGAAGLLSYELGGCWERLPSPEQDEFGFPALAVGIYDWVIAWDHQQQRAWIISQGFPETSRDSRRERAAKRLSWVKDRLAQFRSREHFAKTSSDTPHDGQFANQCEVPNHPLLLSNFSREQYLGAVARAVEYIYAGEAFQVNLSQRLLHPLTTHPVELYGRLRDCNPAPFAAYFAHDDWAVVSASPERFVQITGGEVSTRPIKGTRRRQSLPEADLYTRDELRESEKDQAENVMIVDLLRNDLSRVCDAGSIHVPALCQVETYETVQHLVSEIRGRLRDEFNGWDLLAAVFPGGSITGAPKVRAMEIISELERTARGPYCGSMFYIGFDGAMDSNILIRTFSVRHGWVQCSVGGGIVAQSSPQAEYDETWHKAAGMLTALDGAGRGD